MRCNHFDSAVMRSDPDHSPRDLFYESVYIEGFGRMTVCRYCGNAKEVGHAASCPACEQKRH